MGTGLLFEPGSPWKDGHGKRSHNAGRFPVRVRAPRGASSLEIIGEVRPDASPTCSCIMPRALRSSRRDGAMLVLAAFRFSRPAPAGLAPVQTPPLPQSAPVPCLHNPDRVRSRCRAIRALARQRAWFLSLGKDQARRPARRASEGTGAAVRAERRSDGGSVPGEGLAVS